MTLASFTEAVNEVSVGMGTSCEGAPPATAGTGNPALDCKPGGLSAFLRSDGPQGLSTGCCDGRKERCRCKIVHSQVLRIRKEDHRLGEDDVREGLGAGEKVAFLQASSRMGVLFYARLILPSSPGTKAPMN